MTSSAGMRPLAMTSAPGGAGRRRTVPPRCSRTAARRPRRRAHECCALGEVVLVQQPGLDALEDGRVEVTVAVEVGELDRGEVPVLGPAGDLQVGDADDAAVDGSTSADSASPVKFAPGTRRRVVDGPDVRAGLDHVLSLVRNRTGAGPGRRFHPRLALASHAIPGGLGPPPVVEPTTRTRAHGRVRLERDGREERQMTAFTVWKFRDPEGSGARGGAAHGSGVRGPGEDHRPRGDVVAAGRRRSPSSTTSTTAASAARRGGRCGAAGRGAVHDRWWVWRSARASAPWPRRRRDRHHGTTSERIPDGDHRGASLFLVTDEGDLARRAGASHRRDAEG